MMEFSGTFDPLSLLLSDQEVSLGSWFAEPLSVQQAGMRLPEIRRQQQLCFSRGEPCFGPRLAEFVAHYWCGRDLEAEHRNLYALVADRREEAMLRLCYGQLLIARKQRVAWEFLDTGFELAAHLLGPEEYFLVLKRHELLRMLPLHTQPVKPAGLKELLAEAAVIRRLKGPGDRPASPGTGHQDTLD